jgi:hypothetical protein
LLTVDSTTDINSPAIETEVNSLKRRAGAIAPAGGLALLAMALTGGAQAQKIRMGDIVLTADGGFSLTRLPRHEDAPITLRGGGAISTVSGALPPVLETLDIEFDRHGSVETLGLPKCTTAKLASTLTKQARKACPGAIVGRGRGRALVAFPEDPPIDVEAPITLFNGPPRHGDPTVIAHAYTTYPVPVTLLVPIEIERIHKGVYGYRTRARIPKLAGGSGIPISGHLAIGRRWTYKGVERSYLNARCETGHLQAQVEATFKDHTFLSGVFIKPCQVRR